MFPCTFIEVLKLCTHEDIRPKPSLLSLSKNAVRSMEGSLRERCKVYITMIFLLIVTAIYNQRLLLQRRKIFFLSDVPRSADRYQKRWFLVAIVSARSSPNTSPPIKLNFYTLKEVNLL